MTINCAATNISKTNSILVKYYESPTIVITSTIEASEQTRPRYS